MICSGLAMWPGLRGVKQFETVKPVKPAFGLEPRPVAPSSQISPPAPVDAPGKKLPLDGYGFPPSSAHASAHGAIALIAACARLRQETAILHKIAGFSPSMTERCLNTPPPCAAELSFSVLRIMPNNFVLEHTINR
jgi:hypothetical protein